MLHPGAGNQLVAPLPPQWPSSNLAGQLSGVTALSEQLCAAHAGVAATVQHAAVHQSQSQNHTQLQQQTKPGGTGPLPGNHAVWFRECAEPIDGRSLTWPDLLSVFQQLLTDIAVSPHISLGQMAALASLSPTLPKRLRGHL